MDIASVLPVKVCSGVFYFSNSSALYIQQVWRNSLACVHGAVPVPGGCGNGHISNGVYCLVTVGLKQSGIKD